MSRRFKSRRGPVTAHPDALPKAPVVLDDENSWLDPMENVRKPNVPNHRFYAVAESLIAAKKAAAAAAAAKAEADLAP